MAIPSTTKPSATKSKSRLLVFSADSEAALQEDVARIQNQIVSQPESLADIASALNEKRDHGAYRAFAVTDGSSSLKPSSVIQKQLEPVLNFVFTGLGAQWPRMAADLFENFESFRKDVKQMDKALQTIPHPPLWTIEDEISRPSSTSRINKAEFSTPICCALQIGIVNIFRSWGVSPDAVVGHSSGEIAAAHTAGAMSMAEAITIAYYYGQAAEGLPQGAMAAVGLSAKDMQSYFEDLENVTIGCINSRSNVTVSGAEEEVDMLIERVKKDKPDVVARRLRVDRGYHNLYSEYGISSKFERNLSGGLLKPSSKLTAPLYSTVRKDSRVLDGNVLNPSYWRSNLEQPVLFSNAVEELLNASKGQGVFLEIGPHSALEKPLKEVVEGEGGDQTAFYVPTMRRNANGPESLLTSLGRLFQEHGDVHVSATV